MFTFANLMIFGASVTSMFSVIHSKASLCPMTTFCYCNETTHVANCTKTEQVLTSIPELPSYVYHILLDGNYFPTIVKDTFNSISGNNIMSISMVNAGLHHISSDAFEALNHLQSLNLSFNGNINITSLKQSLLSLRSDNMQSLVFKHIGWKNASIKLFSNLHKKISDISIHDNPLFQLNEGIFDGLEQLLSMDATHINLSACGQGLKELQSLLAIDLSNNHIAVCNTNVLPQTLQELDLAYNALSTIPEFCSPKYTSNAPSLKTLMLYNNNIHHITNQSFDCLPSIESISIQNNRLLTIASKAFYYLNGLQTLFASNVVSSYSFELNCSSDAFYVPSLKTLVFSFNAIVPNITNCTRLEYVDLSNIQPPLYAFNIKKLLGRLPNLKRLDMSQNYLKSIPTGFFELFPNLEYVNLYGNDITELTSSQFCVQSRIKMMFLGSNSIYHIGYDTFPQKFWQNIELLDLSDNPFNCDCNLLWFRDKFKASTKTFVVLRLFPIEYECSSPPELAGLYLGNFNLTYNECKPKSDIVTVLASCGSFVVVVAISLLILYKGRWHFRYWIYLLRYRRPAYRRLNNVYMQYDAFVIFADEDEEFVLNTLLPRLEKEEQSMIGIFNQED